MRIGGKKIFLAATVCIIFFKFAAYDLVNKQLKANGYKTIGHSTGRHLLSGVAWEKCDFEIGHIRNYSDPDSWHSPASSKSWVPVYILLVLILFVALAVICDDFFVPSLEAISEKLNLSEDVAGATFMAAGSSAPELFTSIAGVTAESDVGVGTIVGSAVFNLLGICALAAAFSGSVLQLDWRPLTRDATFYSLSICLFLLFGMDGKFEIYESIIMLILYFLYIVIMKFNPKLMKLMSRLSKTKKVRPSLVPSKCPGKEYEEEEEVEFELEQPVGEDNTEEYEGSDTNMGEHDKKRFSHKRKLTNKQEEGGDNDDEEDINPETADDEGRKFSHKKGSIVNALKLDGEISTENAGVAVNDNNDDGDGDDEDGYSYIICPCLAPVGLDLPTQHGSEALQICRYILSWILYIMSTPFIIMFSWTIPDCSTPENRKWYIVSFIMSIVWIAALSFGIVTLVGRAGCILQIDKFTMGLVVVAIGTSIPDAMSSVLVARDGFGDMAVSNAIGSNVFDIDLGIGLPFFISSCIKGEAVHLLSPAMEAEYNSGELPIIPHVKFGIILLIILALALSLFILFKFKLGKHLGISFILLYFLFLIYAFIQDVYCDSKSC